MGGTTGRVQGGVVGFTALFCDTQPHTLLSFILTLENFRNSFAHSGNKGLTLERLSLQDDFPLASLPLLGYSVTTPTDTDNIHKDYVFKLQFKNHVYFFRAESEYTFSR